MTACLSSRFSWTEQNQTDFTTLQGDFIEFCFLKLSTSALGITIPKLCRHSSCVGRKKPLFHRSSKGSTTRLWLSVSTNSALQWAGCRWAASDTASPMSPTTQKWGFGFQNEWLCPTATETPPAPKHHYLWDICHEAQTGGASVQ